MDAYTRLRRNHRRTKYIPWLLPAKIIVGGLIGACLGKLVLIYLGA